MLTQRALLPDVPARNWLEHTDTRDPLLKTDAEWEAIGFQRDKSFERIPFITSPCGKIHYYDYAQVDPIPNAPPHIERRRNDYYNLIEERHAPLAQWRETHTPHRTLKLYRRK